MDKQLIRAYLREYSQKYYEETIFEHYPEARLLPAYIRCHFDRAKIVLDLGFGSGLWFWASFLPALERIDGIDQYREALEEANRVFEVDRVPAGYAVAQQQAGRIFTLDDLKQLAHKAGYFAFQDYRQPWPEAIVQTRYDLVTEHGGGLGQMDSEAELVAVIEKVAQVLKPSGHFLFVNFDIRPSELEEKLGQAPASSGWLDPELFKEAIHQANLKVADLHVLTPRSNGGNVERFFYGYAHK